MASLRETLIKKHVALIESSTNEVGQRHRAARSRRDPAGRTDAKKAKKVSTGRHAAALEGEAKKSQCRGVVVADERSRAPLELASAMLKLEREVLLLLLLLKKSVLVS